MEKSILKAAALTFLYTLGNKNFSMNEKTNRISSSRFKRPCINCGTKHDHNQPWCSASCATQWREAYPEQGKIEHVLRLQKHRETRVPIHFPF